MNNLAIQHRTERLFVLMLTTGLALLVLIAIMWGLAGVAPARADPGERYVDGASGGNNSDCSDPASPCATIGYAITQAVDGDEIRVAQGTYMENLTVNINITLNGGYEPISWTRSITQYETIINGSGGISQSAVTIPGGSFDVTLDGFTITGGDTSGNGGGVLVESNASVIVANSVITGNQSTGDGGGIAAPGPVTLTLQDVVVANNQAGAINPPGNGGGLYIRGGAQATLTGVNIYGNTAIEGGGGIGLDDTGTSVVISDSLIHENSSLGGGGGGIGVWQGGSISLSRSSLTGNSAPNHEGGGINANGNASVTVEDSIIADNLTSDHGGAVSTFQVSVNLTNVLLTGNETTSDNANVLAINESDVTIINSTISDNNPQGAQAILLWSGHLTITNSIMWNNALNLQADPPCPTCFTVTYSDLQGGWPGTGNIDQDPNYVDPANDDYHLSLGSPCIDSGTNTGAPDHDLNQNPRPLDGDGDGTATTDMGVYELQLFQNYLPVALKNYEP